MEDRIPSLPKSRYTTHKPLSDGLYLVRRSGDGELLLARPLEIDDVSQEAYQLAELIREGAADAAAALLNHENLVSIYDETVEIPAAAALPPQDPFGRDDNDNASSSESSEDKKRGSRRFRPNAIAVRITRPVNSRPLRMLLWDYADQGTLQDVLDDYYPPGGSTDIATAGKREKIPESFIWHVTLSLLSALQYLHTGRRNVKQAVPQTAEEAEEDANALRLALGEAAASEKLRRWFTRERIVEEPYEDWWPVLHRNIKPENVFLQRPRGTETYGPVKLGGFERCFVASGAVPNGPVIGPEGDEEVGVAALRNRMVRWKADGLEVNRLERPYTQGNDIYAVGRLMYHMMVGSELPPAEECPGCECIHVRTRERDRGPECPHDCVGDVNTERVLGELTEYTEGLRQTAIGLLQQNRRNTCQATIELDLAWPHYEKWLSTTGDGRLYRDEYDDMWFRQQNKARLSKKRRAEEEEDKKETLKPEYAAATMY